MPPDVGDKKRMRMSPPPIPNIDEMDVTTPMDGHSRNQAGSDASSDWGDWADAMVAQGEHLVERVAEGGDGVEGGGGSAAAAKHDEEEEWVRSMMEQGTVGSVIEGMDSPAWDYVLQMVVDESEQRGSAATMESPTQEIEGVAATEFVSRWLRRNLPIALPALNTLALVVGGCAQQQQHQVRSSSGDGRGRQHVLAGRAVVDSVAEPSAVAVVSSSPQQRMRRVTLFSLSANSGAALAATVVQPGAVGLLAPTMGVSCQEELDAGSLKNDTSREFLANRVATAGDSGRGVVFESLDSRILEDALVSAMGRLGLGVKCRSRSGLWKLRPAAVLLAADASTSKAKVRPLAVEDASFIARCCANSQLGAPTTGPGRPDGAEALIHGLIRRNPSAGIRRGNQLVAWCLSFDNGLAGALHVESSTAETIFPPRPFPSFSFDPSGEKEEKGHCSPQCLVLALLASMLAQPPDTEYTVHSTLISPTACGDEEADRPASDTAIGPAEQQSGLSGSWVKSDSVGSASVGLAAVVVDDDSPFVGLFQELDLLERVCDADWVRFEPVDRRSNSSGTPAVVVNGGEGRGGSGHLQLPLSALVLQP